VTVAGLACGWLALGTPRALLLVTIIGALVTLGRWQLSQGPERPHPSGPEFMCGVVSGTAALAVTGLVATLGPLGWLLIALVAASGWWVLRSPTGIPAPRRPPSDSEQPTASRGLAIESLPAPPWPPLASIATMSTPQLCWAWRVSYVRIQRSTYPGELEDVAQLRCACLEELHRRDPAGFARWFPTARAASDPTRFFCHHPAEPATGNAPTAIAPRSAAFRPSQRSDRCRRPDTAQ
jgi:hypothetical protein